MKQKIRLILLYGFVSTLASCTRTLTKENAESILRKVYEGGNNDDEAGGIRVHINSITIDSIHQGSDTALVFYRVSGRVDNGSAYPKDLDAGEQQDHFVRSATGWKEGK